MTRHLVTLQDLTTSEIETVFAISQDLKQKFLEGVREPLLPGRVLAMLFEKPSLRTRVSFESAMAHLGGNSLFLGQDVGWGKRESIEDFCRVISQYADAIVCRANQHARVEELAKHCNCSIINGLTDIAHPVQALADLFTMQEVHGKLKGQTLAYVGDANNVAYSLALGCGRLGVRMSLASPEGYQFSAAVLEELKASVPDLDLEKTADPRHAVSEADAVYTDVWTSMGQEAERKKREQAFADFQVNAALLAAAPDRAIFLHCLPARRGEEVTDEIMDGHQSAVFQQAGNRLHVQKGLLAWLLGAKA